MRELPIALVPQPTKLTRKAGVFLLTRNTTILVDMHSTDAASVGRQLAERLNRRPAGICKSLRGTKNTVPARLFSRQPAPMPLGSEEYQLEVAADGVVIWAAAGAGLFYGTQTLLQLLPPQVFSPAKVEGAVVVAPAVSIADDPRFSLRGLMLDVRVLFQQGRGRTSST